MMLKYNHFKKTFFSLLFLIIVSPAFAAKGYKINVKINGLAKDTIYLAYHFGDKQYMKDTTALDVKGMGAFQGDEPLPGGVYLIVMPSKNYFEIIVNEQEFSIENDTTDFINKFKSTGSVENKIFYEDIRFINGKQKEKVELQAKVKEAKGEEEKKLKDQLSKLDEEVKSQRKNIQVMHPNSFYAKFLKSLEDPEIPEAPKDEKGNPIDSFFAYKYYKAHYFDNIDFSDDRMLRTPTFHNKVMNYIDKMTTQIPDSLNAACDVILEKAKADDAVFQYFCVLFLNQYAKSNIMGMDAVYVHLVEKYYATGKATWVSEDDIYRIVDRAKALKPTLIGKTAPNMLLRDPDKNLIPLHSVKAKYTMLFIYAPDCGHCKKETPKIVESYKKIVDTMGVDLKVYAAPTMHLHKGEYDDNKRPIFSTDPKDLNEWLDFIKEHKMERWINVADLYLQDNFRETYDVSSTPREFLLDKDKKIIAKRFSAEQLVDIITDLERIEKEKAK